MKKTVLFILLLVTGCSYQPIINNETKMNIQSSAFVHNQKIPSQYTCDGENTNPPLSFNELPEKTKSLVLIVDDHDASVGMWVHWTVWNIDPIDVVIKEGEGSATGVEGVNSFGSIGYGGPCPLGGMHRYFYKVYALDSMLDLDSSATKDSIVKAMEGHIIEKAELIGLYARQ